MTYDIHYKRIYEYQCRGGCGKKRKTRKYQDAQKRICTVCRKRIIAAEEDERQMKLFGV